MQATNRNAPSLFSSVAAVASTRVHLGAASYPQPPVGAAGQGRRALTGGAQDGQEAAASSVNSTQGEQGIAQRRGAGLAEAGGGGATSPGKPCRRPLILTKYPWFE